MRPSYIWEKIGASLINMGIVGIFFIPFHLLIADLLVKKVIFVLLFFIYITIFLCFNHNRCVGMMIMQMYYGGEFRFCAHLLYNVFYTMSFATCIFWVWIPGDLFMINMIFLQIPFIMFTGTTFHGYISGNIITMKDK